MKNYILLLAVFLLCFNCSKENFSEVAPSYASHGSDKFEQEVIDYLATQSGTPGAFKDRDALTVYQDHQVQIFQRLNAMAKGMIEPMKNSQIKNFIMQGCNQKACEGDEKILASELVNYSNLQGMDILEMIRQSVILHSGNAQHAQLASDNFSAMQIAGYNFYPTIVSPYLDSDLRSLGNIAGWDSKTPEYVTTSSSFINSNQMLVYKMDGTPFIADAEYLANHPGIILSLKRQNDDGTILPLRPIEKHRCPKDGTTETNGCKGGNSGVLCRVVFLGFIAIGNGNCGAGNTPL